MIKGVLEKGPFRGSKQVTITKSPDQPRVLSVRKWRYRWHLLSDLKPVPRLPWSSDSQRLVYFLYFFFYPPSAYKLLAAHSRYPLIKPVTLSVGVTLKKYTNLTLCFETKDRPPLGRRYQLPLSCRPLGDPCRGNTVKHLAGLFYVAPLKILMS